MHAPQRLQVFREGSPVDPAEFDFREPFASRRPRTIVAERKAREFDPTMQVLRECMADKDFAKEDVGAQRRIEETLALMESLSAWGDEMLRLDPSTLVKVMKLGAKIQVLIRSGKSKDEKKSGRDRGRS